MPNQPGELMRHLSTASPARHGITVIGLLLLIIALVVAGIFLVRFLRSRPVATGSSPLSYVMRSPWPRERLGITSAPESLDQLNLSGVIQVVRGDPVYLLGVGPHSFG